ncbi:bifunctional diguanylate cyclase/phosphodiesterase [Granulosicoccus sp. 3-233]|uniref:bifunctional diguanylate cyclase/phosphodiesterase n=1 Tax=Granulosicoccus sp. 3-233 TaxID=3417969 RepID=UPI003D32B0CC
MRLHEKLLFAIVPVFIVSLLSVGWIVYVQLRQHSQDAMYRQMDTVLQQTRQQTESFSETLQANALLFANSNMIQRYVMVEDEADRYDLMQPALLKLFASYQEAYPQYREIRLLTPSGYEDTRLAIDGLPNRSDEESGTPFFDALESGRTPFHMEIRRNADDGQTTLTIGRPLWVKDLNVPPQIAENRLRGYLVVTATLGFLESLLREQTLGNEGYLMVLDQRGTVLFHQKPHLVGSTLYSLMFSLADIPPGTAASDIPIRNFRNTVQWHPLQNDLVLVAVVPESEFAAASRTLARSVGSITLLAIMLASLTFFLLIRTTVLRPIGRLREAAIAFGNGDSGVQIDINRADEIGDLARALSGMNRKLVLSMSELQHSHARIEQLAYRDTLTDLPNRRLFIRLAEQAMSQGSLDSSKLAVLFLDLDDFKRVNDTLGHEAGDLLLQEVSTRLQHCIRESEELASPDLKATRIANQVARIGGDEFLILITSLGHPEHTTIVARKIIDELARPVNIGDRSFVVGTSIGIAMYPSDAPDVDGLIKCADTAMYEAKRAHKNTYRYYGAPMQANIENRLLLEEDLRRAIKKGEFELYFQPQFDTRSGIMAGAEVLLRWNHPQRGMVPPDIFIPVAEDTGMIAGLGEWVLMQACRQWRDWQDRRIAPRRIAVNVSQRQFALGNLMAAVDNALLSNDMDADNLELELTESCMMQAPTEVVETLQTLRSRGVRIAMDDFGTGYSSLGALTSLPIDTLKIDRSFVSGIEEDSQNSLVVSAILMLARSLNLEIVAEGVEVQAELDYLAKRDCDIVQGYLLGKPLTASSMTELLVTLKNSTLQMTG